MNDAVVITGSPPNLMIEVLGYAPLTALEAERLAREIQEAVKKVRSGNRPRHKMGDSR